MVANAFTHSLRSLAHLKQVTIFSDSHLEFHPHRYGDGADGEKMYIVRCAVRKEAGFAGPIALFLNALFLLYGVYEAYQIRNLDKGTLA